MPFQNLPQSCQSLIADFLCKEDFPNLRLTSKEGRQAIEQTKRGKKIRQILTLQPSNLELFCFKVVNKLPKFESLSPAIPLGILAGVVFNSLGRFVLSSLGVNQEISIVLTCCALILKSVHTQFITKDMSTSEHLALFNLVLVTYLIMVKKNNPSVLDPLICGIDMVGINAVGAGIIAAGNRFQMFYNSKKQIVSELIQEANALEYP